MLSSAESGVTGVYNTVSRPGHAKWGQLLDAARRVTGERARLVWAPPDVVLRAGLRPWTQLPIWVPPSGELAGLHDGDVTAAIRRGLTCRPVEETVAATWRWLQLEGDPPGLVEGRVGYRSEHERRVLDSLPLAAGGRP